MFKHGFPPEWSTFKKLIWLVGSGIAGAASGIWKTVTGTLIHITDALASTMQKCEVTLEPIQDLHGQDAPYPAGGGTQLFNPNTINEGKGLDGSGQLVNSSVNNTSDYIPVLPNTKYTISQDAFSGTKTVAFYLPDKKYLSGGSNYTETPYTFTTTAICAYVRFSYAQENTSSLLFNKGEYSNICPITGWTGCEVNVTGENLWGGEKLKSDILAIVPDSTSDDVNKTVSYAAQKIVDKILFSDFKPNTRYTLIWTFSNPQERSNIGFKYSDGTSSILTTNTSQKATKILVSTSGKTVVAVIGFNSAATTTVYYEESGLFEGVLTADDFEPYSGTTLSVTFPDSTGTVYGGTVDLVSGVLTVTWVADVLNGTQEIGLVWGGIDTSAWLYKANAFDIRTTNVSPIDTIKSNKYPSKTYPNLYNGQIGIGNAKPSSALYSVVIRIDVQGLSTKQLINAYLAENPIQICYQLENPIEIQLTPQQISTLKGENNVWGDGTIELTYKAQAE